MDTNLVVVCGRLATDPEVRVFDSGARVLKFLVTVRATKPRRRIDVIPAEIWDPTDALMDSLPRAGDRVWVTGSLQRRMIDRIGIQRTQIVVTVDQLTFVLEGKVSEYATDPNRAQGGSERAGGGLREGGADYVRGDQ